MLKVKQVSVRLDDGVSRGSCLPIQRLKRCRIIQGSEADAGAPGWRLREIVCEAD